jgi:hypothetical protein
MVNVHLRGLWDRLIQEGIPFKPHWGKINFLDPEFVAENFHLDEFSESIQPLFLNDYVASRIQT